MDAAIENKIIKTQKVSSAEYNFKTLIGKRFDAFLESESVVLSYFQKHPDWADTDYPCPCSCIQRCVQSRHFKKIKIRRYAG